MASATSTLDFQFQIAKLYADRADFKTSLEKLAPIIVDSLALGDHDIYLQALNLKLRMLAELEEFDEIDIAKTELQTLVANKTVALNSRTCYTLGLCSSYKQQYKTALEYLEKGLALALTQDNKKDICYAISGLSIVYTAMGRLNEALKEIYNLQVFFQFIQIYDLQISAQLMNGHILRKLKRYDEAIDVFNSAYEGLRQSKNLYMYVSLLYALGATYADAGDKDQAILYLNLARRTVDPDNLKHLHNAVTDRLKSLGARASSKYDLIFDESGAVVTERKKGKIEFKNQFILLDMLRLFVKNPGSVYSKEDLVSAIWHQDYDPRVHDNKIYVTIKRLRKLLEPDYDKPKYIFRAKNGYYFNKNARVMVHA